VRGELAEQTWSQGVTQDRILLEGEGRSFGSHHVHNVTNLGEEAALSVHVYSPALRGMTRYAVLDGALRPTGVERAGQRW
jgi:Cysteine dioxygenase type I